MPSDASRPPNVAAVWMYIYPNTCKKLHSSAILVMSAVYPLLLRNKVAPKMSQTKDDVKRKGMPKKETGFL